MTNTETGREAFRLRVNWSSKLKLTGKTSIFPTFGLLRIQQPAKTIVDPLLLICSQRRFHLFTSIQKSTCKAPKHLLARNPMQKMQSSTFVLTWEMLFCPQTANKCYLNESCFHRATVTFKMAPARPALMLQRSHDSILTTADQWMQEHWFRALELKYYGSRHFRQELTKLLISRWWITTISFALFPKNAFIIKLRSKFIIKMIRKSLHSTLTPQNKMYLL